MDIKDQIIKDIKEKDIKPTPKIYFILKNILFWSFWVISVFVGSMAVSAIIFLIQTNDWKMYRYVSNTLPEFVFRTLPYFWIVLFLMFIAIAYFAFRNTKGAYRYRIQKIVLATLILSMIFGIGLSKARMGMMLDNTFENRVPMYRDMKVRQFDMWDRPDKGAIFGRVGEIKQDYFILECGCNRTWNIYGKDPNGLENVKVFGQRLNETDFRAIEILPAPHMPKPNCERKIKGIRIIK